MAYELAAAEVSQGRDVMEWWRTRRQLWSYFLALFYTWTGPDFNVARVVNIGCSVVTVLFMYLAVERLLGWPVALASSVAMSLDPNLQGMSLTLLSETFGLFLLAWHFERLASSLTTSRFGLVVSGVMLALSNVARSLTLFVVPLDMLAIVWFSRRRGFSWKEGIGSAAAFAVGVALVVGPYTYMQYLRTGIASMSDNMAMHLYCATSTKFPVWTHDVELVPIEAGINDVKGKYDFFMKGAKEQFRADPSVFIRNVSASMVPPFKDIVAVSQRSFWPSVLVLTVVFLVMHSSLSASTRWGFGTIFWGVILSVTLMGVHQYAPNGLLLGLIALAVMRSLLVRDDESLLLALLGGIVVVTSGVFVYWAEDRLSIFLQPFAAILALAGVRVIYRLGPSMMTLLAGGRLPRDLEPIPQGAGRWRPVFMTALMLFMVTSGTRLVWARLVSPLPEQVVPAGTIGCDAMSQILSYAVTRRPHLFTSAERERAARPIGPEEDFFGSMVSYDRVANGRLAVVYGHIDRHCYYFPKGLRVANGNRFFRFRSYARTVFSFRGHFGCRGGFWNELAVFPGREAYEHIGESYIIIGRNSHQPTNRYQEYVTEGIMMLPYDAATGSFDLDRAIFADDAAHQAMLAELLNPPVEQANSGNATP
jgi:hypothetical protein